MINFDSPTLPNGVIELFMFAIAVWEHDLTKFVLTLMHVMIVLDLLYFKVML